MIIIDRRTECDDGSRRSRAAIDGIAIHRFGAELAHDAAGIARFYRVNPKYTGGHMPYTYIISPGGVIEQALDVWNVGPHARKWSSPMIGLCFLGDFRKATMPREQFEAGVDILSELCAWLGEVNIRRHDELPGGSKDPDKKCPGDYLDVGHLSAVVSQQIKESALQRMIDSTA